MENNSSIKDKIENVLNSLDKLDRATPHPFFYTRLMARVHNRYQNKWEKYSAFITRPLVAFSGIFLIVFMNLFAAYLNLKTSANSEPAEAAITDEYTQVATNFYDLENIKP